MFFLFKSVGVSGDAAAAATPRRQRQLEAVGRYGDATGSQFEIAGAAYIEVLKQIRQHYEGVALHESLTDTRSLAGAEWDKVRGLDDLSRARQEPLGFKR